MDLFICEICNKENTDKSCSMSILDVHICKFCLKSIVETQIGTLKYGYYKMLIKKMWVDYIIAKC